MGIIKRLFGLGDRSSNGKLVTPSGINLIKPSRTRRSGPVNLGGVARALGKAGLVALLISTAVQTTRNLAAYAGRRAGERPPKVKVEKPSIPKQLRFLAKLYSVSATNELQRTVLEFIDSQAKLYQIPPEAVALALESHPRNPDGLVKAKKNLQQITNDSRFSEAEEQKAANIVKILTDFLALPKEQQKAADTMMQTPGTRSQLIYRLRKKEYI